MPGGLWKNRAPLSIENFSKDAGNQSSQLGVEFQDIFSAAGFQLGSSEGGNFNTIQFTIFVDSKIQKMFY